jgi:hypothetical protein
MSRPKRGAQKFHDISSRCHPEQSEGSMHSACGISEWPTLQRFSAVILSAADTSQSEVPAESKDPYISAVKNCQDHRVTSMAARGILQLVSCPHPHMRYQSRRCSRSLACGPKDRRIEVVYECRNARSR